MYILTIAVSLVWTLMHSGKLRGSCGLNSSLTTDWCLDVSTLDRRTTDSDLVPTTGRGSRLTELGPPVSPLCIAMLGWWLWDAGQVCTQSCHTVTLVVLEVSVPGWGRANLAALHGTRLQSPPP